MSRTAVMTGATGKIGSAAVKRMAKMGINVVMVTHNPDAAANLEKECADMPGKVVAMSNKNGDSAVFGDVYERFGSVDIVIPAHGGPDHMEAIKDITDDEFAHRFNHQVINTFNMIRSALPYLEKSGDGRVILISSVGAYSGSPAYSFTGSVVNGAVTSMMKYLARQYADKNIRFNCIAKGIMEPDHVSPDHPAPALPDDIPLGRPGTAEDFGNAVAFLVDPRSDYINGQTILLDGGK